MNAATQITKEQVNSIARDLGITCYAWGEGVGPTSIIDPQIDPKIVEKCLTWILQAKKSHIHRQSTYRLKHYVEEWYNDKSDDYFYVPQGNFIVAAVLAGFRVVRRRGTSNGRVYVW